MFIFPLAGTDLNKIIKIWVRKKLSQEALYNRCRRGKTWPNISPLLMATFHFPSGLKMKMK
jgi:DNA/RNA-binding domain of Phe-tRNA-synthetase-like protein